MLARNGELVYTKFKVFFGKNGMSKASSATDASTRRQKRCGKNREADREVEWRTMRLREFDTYLRMRHRALEYMHTKSAPSQALRPRSFKPERVLKLPLIPGIRPGFSIDVVDELIYLLDLPVPTVFPELLANLHSTRLGSVPGGVGILPGSKMCGLRHLSWGGRPAMGPLMYIGVPGAFTSFHLDGRGTVDSAHLCLQGENEVIMLRRLSRSNNAIAMRILSGGRSGLNSLPHGKGEKPFWPSAASIRSLDRMGALPTCFSLREGELVHINKARLHAFRKIEMPTGQSTSNCSNPTRSNIRPFPSNVCVSVAWDWTFQGFSAKGVFEEARTALENAASNQILRAHSLGIPKTCAIMAASSSLSLFESLSRAEDSTKSKAGGIRNSNEGTGTVPGGRALTILRGLCDVVKFLRDEEDAATKFVLSPSGVRLASESDHRILSRSQKRKNYKVTPRCVDTWIASETPVDPYGVEGFQCKSCKVATWAGELGFCFTCMYSA